MLKKILAVIAAIGSALSAIFFVLFKQAKEEKKAINEKYDNMKENLDALTEADKAANKVRKDNEELTQKARGDNKLDSFDACNELLSK